MKWFWIILAVLVGGAIVVLMQPPRGMRTTEAARIAADVDAILSEPPTRGSGPTPAGPSAPAPSPSADPTASNDRAQALAADLLTERATATKPTLAAPSDAAIVDGEPINDGLDRTIQNATVIAAPFVRRPDGTLLANNRWVLKGRGSPDDPIVVPWELLTSAMDHFQPRTGVQEIPQYIAFLDGKRIRIEGYIIFPIVARETQQLLVTFNQWDGCCIGIPPTAFDAIEVTLASTIPLNRRHGLLFGAVSGVFKVEPLASDGWLLGMYLLDDASLKVDL
jgi:hypothetical protein